MSNWGRLTEHAVEHHLNKLLRELKAIERHRNLLDDEAVVLVEP